MSWSSGTGEMDIPAGVLPHSNDNSEIRLPSGVSLHDDVKLEEIASSSSPAGISIAATTVPVSPSLYPNR